MYFFQHFLCCFNITLHIKIHIFQRSYNSGYGTWLIEANIIENFFVFTLFTQEFNLVEIFTVLAIYIMLRMHSLFSMYPYSIVLSASMNVTRRGRPIRPQRSREHDYWGVHFEKVYGTSKKTGNRIITGSKCMHCHNTYSIRDKPKLRRHLQ